VDRPGAAARGEGQEVVTGGEFDLFDVLSGRLDRADQEVSGG
jgi:hypothetical protein